MPSNFDIAFFNVALLLPPVVVLLGFVSLLVPRRRVSQNVHSYKHAA
jgi:hypothetical protein